MATDKVTEAELAAKAVAPRVTEDALKANIAHVFFKRGIDFYGPSRGDPYGDPENAPSSLKCLTICVAVTTNGFTLIGKSACASPENYDRKIGERLAYADAERQLWALMGYELRSKLHNIQQLEEKDLGEALTRMTALRLGNAKTFRAEDAELILSHFEGTDHQEEGGETFATVKPSDEELVEVVWRVFKYLSIPTNTNLLQYIKSLRADPAAKPSGTSLEESIIFALVRAADERDGPE